MARKKPVALAVESSSESGSSEGEVEYAGASNGESEDMISEDNDGNSDIDEVGADEAELSGESDAESDSGDEEEEVGEDEDGDDMDSEEEGEDEGEDEALSGNGKDNEGAAGSNGRKNARASSAGDGSAARAAKRAKAALPTKDEQLQLHNTETLMRTNLLRMQVDEMLGEVRADTLFEKRKLQDWVQRCISSIESGCAALEKARTTLSQSWIASKKIHGFVFEGKDNEQATAQFVAPTSVSVVGSSALKTATAPFLNVDIAVAMPEQLFENRDLLNHAYFNKRKFYVAALYSVLKSAAGLEGDVSVSLFKGDPRKPMVVIKPALKGSITVRIIPTLPASAFKLVQLKSSKNNVRPLSWAEKETKSVSHAEASTLRPTPRYNMAVLEDMAAQTQARFLVQTLSVCPVARDAVLLLKIWLTQRSLRFGFDCMDSHSATLLVAYLVQTKRITTQMTALAAFTLALKILTDNDLKSSQFSFTNTAIVQSSAAAADASGEPVWAMTLLYPVFDTSAGTEKQYDFNVMWRVSPSCLSDLCAEAKHTLRLLQTGRSDESFRRVFMTKSSFFDRHDIFFHLPFDDQCLRNTLLAGGKQGKGQLADTENGDLADERRSELDYALTDAVHWQFVSGRAVEIATRALGNRATAVRAMVSSDKIEASGGAGSSAHSGVFFPSCGVEAERWVVTIGVVLSRQHGQRRIERGPSSEEEAAVAEFRKFWGPNKSHMRRFQDGSIIESVVWEEALQRPGYVPRGERIADEILRHIFARHLPACCGEHSEQVHSKTTQLENRMLPAGGVSTASADPEDADSLTRKAIEYLDQLRTALISTLKDQLPLVVTSVTGTAAALRYTGLTPPKPHPLLQDNFLQKFAGKQISLLSSPLAVCVQVEGGGKWPKDAGAILKLKLAFLLRLADVLHAKLSVITIPHEDSLDIIFKSFVFRLRVVSDMEVEQRLISNVSKEADPNMVYPRLVVETNAVYPLYCNYIRALHAKFPTFAGSVRLLDCWLNGHHFSGAVPHEALEMLVASVYLDPDSGFAPTSPSAGFRKALNRLATFDWESSPLIVDFGGDITAADKGHIQAKFAASRQSRHSPLLYMTSSADRNTGFTPLSRFDEMDRTAVKLVAAMAKDTSTAYNKWVEDSKSSDDGAAIDAIMKSPTTMDRCNVILQFNEGLINAKAIKSELASDWYEHLQRGATFARLKVYANLSKKEVSLENLVVKEGATPHPVQEGVVDALRKGFGDIAVFFWNAQRGTEIGILWKPSAFLTRKFSILESRNKLALQSEDSASSATFTVLNTSEIIAQMFRVGDGLIQQVRFL
jgi:U3 small nucleolar RNA-associated protein 22